MTILIKWAIGIAIVLILGASGTAAFFAHKASKIKPANNIEIRFDHIKKGAVVNLDGVSLSQLMGERYSADTTTINVNLDSLKYE